MKNKKYELIVRGGYGLTNFGDDALLKSINDDYFSHYSSSELAYSSTKAGYLKKYIGNKKILPLDANYSKLANTLVYGGGTQFYAFRKKNNFIQKIEQNWKLLLQPKSLLNKVKKVLNRRQSKRNQNLASELRIVALGIGVGPFLPNANPAIELETKRLFKEMDYVAVRDVYSLKKCKEWGIQDVNLYADLCFKMNHPKFFIENSNNSVEYTGIIVRDWKNTEAGDEYKRNVLNTVENLRKKSKVSFIVFAKDKDSSWIRTLRKSNEDFLTWDPDMDSINSFIQSLSKFDLFITARYHGAIFSAMLGKPFITIDIEPKLSMISEVFSNGSKNWSSPFDPEKLSQYFDFLNENYIESSKNILRVAESQRNLADKMYTDINKMIGK